MSNIRSALFISFLTRYGTTALNIISVVVLSRLLTPDDIGIYSVGAAVIALAHMLRDFGVPNYVIQEKNLTLEKLRTASGLAIIVGWSLALILYIFSGSLASYYEEPGVQAVLVVLAFNFILIPIGVISPALLRREMKFKPLFNIHISGTFVNVSSTIILALNGFGYMAMAWGSLLGIATTAFISLYYLPREYRALPGISEWRAVLNFGSLNTLELFMTQGGKSGAELAIGKITDFATLGLFSRAYGYMDIFRRLVLGAVLPVAHAALAKESRAGAAMDKPYLMALSMMLAVGVPGYLFLSVMAAPFILLLYGDQWTEAATAASLVCISAIPTLMTIINKQALISTGNVKALAFISLVVQPLKLLAVILIAEKGLEAIAVILILAEILHLIVSQYYTGKIIKVEIKLWWKELLVGLFIGLMTIIIPLGVLLFFEGDSLILQILLGVPGACLGWLIGLNIMKHPLGKEVRLVLDKVLSYVR